MRVKDIESKYKVLKNNKCYHLYSLTEHGRLSPIKYLCTVHRHDSTKFFVTGFEPTNSIEALDLQVQEKIKSYEYSSEYYNPMFRAGYFEELVIDGYLYELGFIGSYKNNNVYKLKDKNIYGFISNNISLTISGLDSFSDVYKNGSPAEKVDIILWTGEWSWISHKCNRNVDDIKNGIDGLLKPLMTTDAVSLITKAEKMKTVENFDIVLKKLEASLDVAETDIKSYLKSQLLEIAEKL